jgi:methionyl-tRNA formyltransferase
MRSVFIGAVEGSLVALDTLIASGHVPTAVLTLPPDVSARHSDYADLAPVARAAGSEVLFTKDINASGTIADLRRLAPDLCLVIGWSQICKEEFRSIAKIGNLGFHPAPLPRFRGRAVIPWTILQNEKTSGSSLFWLDEGVDSGPLVSQKMFPVAPDETAQTLYAKHVANLKDMLPKAVQQFEQGVMPRVAQDHALATYCAKRTPADGLIDWRETADDVLRLIRAVGAPYPGAFSWSNGTQIHVDRAVLYAQPPQFVGIAGQIQSHTTNGFTVQCGDGLSIEIVDWRAPNAAKPRVHSKLLGAP